MGIKCFFKIIFLRIAIWLALLSCLSGCLHHVRQPREDNFLWQLRGSVSVTMNQRTDMARFVWCQQRLGYQLDLLSSLNIALLKIRAGTHGVSVIERDRHLNLESLEDFTQQRFGWELPSVSLQFWLWGEVDPGVPVDDLQLTAQRKIKSFVQADWQIEFNYLEKSHNQYPHIIYLRSRIAPIKIKLVITKRVVK